MQRVSSGPRNTRRNPIPSCRNSTVYRLLQKPVAKTPNPSTIDRHPDFVPTIHRLRQQKKKKKSINQPTNVATVVPRERSIPPARPSHEIFHRYHFAVHLATRCPPLYSNRHHCLIGTIHIQCGFLPMISGNDGRVIC